MNKIFNYKHFIMKFLFLFEILTLLFFVIWAIKGRDTLVLQSSDPASFQNLQLRRGTYRAEIDYHSSKSENAGIFLCSTDSPAVLCDQLQFYPWRNSDRMQIWVIRNCHGLNYIDSHTGALTYQNIALYATSADRNILCVVLAFFFILADIFLFWFFRVFWVSKERLCTLFRTLLIIGCIILSCWPLHTSSLIAGDDLVFHLERIEGISETLLTGQFPVRIFTTFLDGAGYCISVFYGDFFLYFAALLRISGFPLQTSLKLYLAAVNITTAVISWYAFSRILKNKWSTVFSTLAYMLALYRLSNIYQRAAVGEATAMIFLPLIFCGFYMLFTGLSGYSETTAKKMISAGMAGILCSHTVSAILTSFILFLWCLFHWKKLLKCRFLLHLFQIILFSFGLSACFLIPFSDYMLTQKINMNTTIGNTYIPAKNGAISFKGLFALSFGHNGVQLFGIILCLLWLLFAFSTFLQYKKTASHAAVFENSILILLTALTFWMMSSYFPWNTLADHFRFFSTFMNSIQFPFRFAEIATVLCAMEGGILFDHIWLAEKRIFKLIPYVILCTASFFAALASSSQLLNSVGPFHIYDRPGLSVYLSYGYPQGYDISDGFYLPVGTDIKKYEGLTVQSSAPSLVQISHMQKKGLRINLNCRNYSDKVQNISVPLLFYKNYQAYDVQTNQHLKLFSGTNSAVTVMIPPEFHSSIAIAYVEPWYWRCAELVSLLCWSALFLSHFIHKKFHILHP